MASGRLEATGRFGATAGVERPGIILLVGLVLLPLIIAGVLAASLTTPTADLDRVTAAIVNEDQPVTINGQTVPVGRQFAAGLMAAQEPLPVPVETPSPAPAGSPAPADAAPAPGTTPAPAPTEITAEASFDWVLTNAGDAETGLASGRYSAVLTIPPDFSAAATSIGGLPSEARQARFLLETTPASAWLDPALVAAVGTQAATTLGMQLTERYLAGVYAGFNEINTQIETASDGAAEVASGADSLADGSTELVDGLAQLAAAVAPLPADTDQLASGADEIAGAVGFAAEQVGQAVDSFADTVAQICQNAGTACDRAQADFNGLERVSEQLDALAAGSSALADGNAALAAAMPDLVDGVDAATSGAGEVSDGASQVDAGATQLAQGLSGADGQLPSFTDDDVATLSPVVAQPVLVDLERQEPPASALTVFVVLALWVGGIAIALAVPAVPPRRLLTGASSGTIAFGAMLRPLLLGFVGGIAAAAIARSGDAASPGSWAAFIVAGAAVGAVFALANLALVAALGAWGRLVAVGIGVVAVAAAVSSTVPPSVTATAGVLPTAPGLALLRAALIGPREAVWTAEVLLALVAVASILLVLAGTAARRGERAVALRGW